MIIWTYAALLFAAILRHVTSSNFAKQLFDDKMLNYNKYVRPVANNTDVVYVKLNLRLIGIVEIEEKNQIMVTNVWLEQEWHDANLMWKREDYGGVEKLYIPNDLIWVPDIVLYNSADGRFVVEKLSTRATVYYNGTVIWKPPTIYRSLCSINVEYFPFDEQKCYLKLGSWTYHGRLVNIRHHSLSSANEEEVVENGVDLSRFSPSAEWDLLETRSEKYVVFYPCCEEPYPDMKFNFTIRRRTLFYTVNMILPCVAICSVTILVFYIPASSGEKITMSITILNSLTIFLLLMAEINPPTSLAVPLLGKYLIFTMVLITCTIIMTIIVLNVHFRSPATHTMSPFTRLVFLDVLPRVLCMQRPTPQQQRAAAGQGPGQGHRHLTSGQNQGHGPIRQQLRCAPGPLDSDSPIFSDGVRTHVLRGPDFERAQVEAAERRHRRHVNPDVRQAMIGVRFIAEYLQRQNESNKVKQDWQFAALIFDRLLLWIFAITCIIASVSIFAQAPALYDTRPPLCGMMNNSGCKSVT